MGIRRWIVRAVLAAVAGPASAAHPLITEDTDTQGQGRFQLELTNEQIRIDRQGISQHAVLTTTVLSYGLIDPLDILVTVPHLRYGVTTDGAPGQHGLADMSLDLKWRLYADDPLSVAVIPGIGFPTGDETRRLGTGRTTWNLFVVSSYKLERWTLHLHVGHVHHNNTFSERVNVWHASAAAVFAATDRLKLIADTGVDTNTERGARSDPVFLVSGLIWSIRRDFDVDFGWRWESRDTDRVRAALAGLTWRW